MATLGQNLDFGFRGSTPRERMRAIREAGFDDVMLSWGGKRGEAFETQVSLAREFGLAARTAHFPTSMAHALWAEGEDGEKYTADLCEALRDYARHGVGHLVMHMTRKLCTKAPGPIGLERLGRALRVAEEVGVDIALENTRFLDYNAYCYDNLSSPRLKFCFDSGHAHCFTPNEDPLARFGSLMVATHLNDNHGPGPGECDEHLLLGQGTIDFGDLFTRMRALKPESYNMETSYEPGLWGGLSMAKYLGMSQGLLAERVARAEGRQATV
jgi:sugar phosphate isomerase/epimerase